MLAMLKMVNFTASVLFNIPSFEGWNEAMVRTWLYQCIPFGYRGPCDWLWPMRSLDHIWSRGPWRGNRGSFASEQGQDTSASASCFNNLTSPSNYSSALRDRKERQGANQIE